MAFRSDWRDLYERLTADPEQFIFALSQGVAANLPTLAGETVPQSFLTYVRGPGAALLEPVLTGQPGLAVYVTSAESTRAVDTNVLSAQTICAQLLAGVRVVGTQGSSLTEVAAIAALRDQLGTLNESVSSRLAHFRSGPEADRIVSAVQAEISAVVAKPEVPAGPPAWARRVEELLVALSETLRRMRSESDTGGTSAA